MILLMPSLSIKICDSRLVNMSCGIGTGILAGFPALRARGHQGRWLRKSAKKFSASAPSVRDKIRPELTFLLALLHR